MALITAGEVCRIARGDLMHGQRGLMAWRRRARFVSPRPLLRITASDLSLVAVQDDMDAVAHLNELPTENGTKDEVEDAFQEEAATTLGMVEIMVRREG